MKKSITFGLALAFAMAFPTQGRAQAVAIPYQMGFEKDEAAEFALRWHINEGSMASSCTDKWVIGDAACNEGKQSLYISANEGESAQFGADTCVQIAYCDLVLPDGQYYVTFDWRCLGNAHTLFYAGMGRRSAIPDSLLVARKGTSKLPNQLNSFVFSAFTGGAYLNANWQNTISNVIKVKSPNNELRLFFAWTTGNDTVDDKVMNVAPCIDNVQVSNALSPVPTDLKVDVMSCDSVLVTWEGTSQGYEFEYRKHGSAQWVKHTGLSSDTKSFLLEGLTEGLYDFRVRSLNLDTIYSAYCYLNNEVVYCPEYHCINFVQLDDPSVCLPFVGSYTNPYELNRLVNYGSADMYSRHTVNMDHDMYDRRTNYELCVIPDGELSSVRLGNWNWGAECEALRFFYTVDAENAAILLLKYAIVMEDPADHDDMAKPHFKLEIRDQSGTLVDPTCGVVDFVAGKDTQGKGWHKNTSYATTVYWKEWTTIGLDLRQYDGQRIQIDLSTYDCLLQGHYGYAYFSLGCANATISSSSCGSDPEMTIDAPDGFNYQWLDSKGQLVPEERGGRSSSIVLEPSDTTTYTCVLSSTETEGCSFTLSTANIPRYPYSDFSTKFSAQNCQSRLQLINNSHVINAFSDSIRHLDEACEEFEWSLVNLDDPSQDTIFSDFTSPMIYLPNEGGHYEISLKSYLSNRGCDNTRTDTVLVPFVGNDTTYFNEVICYGDKPIVIGDAYSTPKMGYYGTDTTVTVHWTSVTGCDSMQIWNVKALPQSITYLPDTTICGEDSLVEGGKRYPYNYSGRFVRFEKNSYGCDSTIHRNVTVLDSIQPTIQMKDIEGDEEYSGEFTLSGTGYVGYYMNGEYHSAHDTHLTGLNGGTFEFEFFNDSNDAYCSVLRVETMRYPCRNIIFQRWGDVLSVMNAKAQAEMGYRQDQIVEFVSFQWYKNDSIIPGATQSYYYEADGLDMETEYRVSGKTTTGDTIISCPFVPTPYSKPQHTAKKVIKRQQLYIDIDGQLYDVYGNAIKEED